jgi:hypothetical protein
MSKNPLLLPVTILGIIVIILGVLLVRSGTSEKEKGKSAPALSMQDLGKGIDGVRIQIKVKKTVGNSEFTDSLYYTPEEWAKVSKEDVEKAVQARIDNWTKTVTAASAADSTPTPAPPVEPAPASAPATDEGKASPAKPIEPVLPTDTTPAP